MSRYIIIAASMFIATANRIGYFKEEVTSDEVPDAAEKVKEGYLELLSEEDNSEADKLAKAEAEKLEAEKLAKVEADKLAKAEAKTEKIK